MDKISAVILTKNEEKSIKDCILCLKFCDEIIVVDDNSSDNTPQIAQKLGAKVFRRDMNMDFSAQSNFGMNKAKGDWVLFIDADERVSKSLANEIMKNIKRSREIKGYLINRIDVIWNKKLKHGESGNAKVLRLVKNGCGKWARRVHPYFIISGNTSLLKNQLLHYPHQSISAFITSIDRWSTWHAIANIEESKRSNVFRIILWPFLHFIKNYILKLGFLDGIEGFLYAITMSMHSYLAWSKQYLIQKDIK